MEIKIDVTQNYIDNGVKSNCEFCPIALAINAVLAEEYFVSVTYCNIIIGNKNKSFARHINLPRIAQFFITNFDCNMDVKPFSFILNVDDDLAFLFKQNN